MRLLKSFLFLFLFLFPLLVPSLAAAQDLVEDTFLFPLDDVDQWDGEHAPRMVSAGDHVAGSRVLAVDEVDIVTGTLVVRPNQLQTPDIHPGCEATITMTVNGQEVAQTTIVPIEEEYLVQEELPASIGGPEYEVSLILTGGVPAGCGFLQLAAGASSWTFSDNIEEGENRRPICNIVGPFECDEGGEVEINANATDPDGQGVEVSWDFDADGDFDDSEEVRPIFPCDVWDGPDTREIRMLVTDGEEDRTCTSEVTVHNVAPDVPLPHRPLLTAAQNLLYDYCLDATDPSPLDPVNYELLEGPEGAVLGEDGCFVWTPAPAQLGSHDFHVRISDDDGGEVDHAWPVMVLEDENTPTAFAGEDVEMEPCATELCCQGTDLRGLALDYRWELVQSPLDNLTIEDVTDDPTAPCIPVVLQAVGNYRFDCYVHNGELESPPDDVWVQVSNQSPTCDPGFDSSCFVEDRCTLDGRRSSDPNDDPMFFRWVQVSPEDQRVTIPGFQNRIASFFAQVPGVYCFQIECRDYEMDGEPAEICVTVNQRWKAAGAPRPDDPEVPKDFLPVAHCGRGLRRVLVGDQVSLDGRRSYDPDGLFLVNHEWSQVSGPEMVSIAGAGNAEATVTPEQEGVYVFSLRVQDAPNHELDYAQPRWSRPCTTTVQAMAADNLPPVADTGEGVVARQGSISVLDGTASHDPDGNQLSYQWRQLRGPGVTLQEADTPTPSVAACTPGIYQFELVVNDGRVDSLPAELWMTVHSPCNGAPIADAGKDIIAFAADGNPDTVFDRIILDGRQSHDSDPDNPPEGHELKYQWLQVGGLPTEVYLEFKPRPFLEATEWDTYTVRLFALDSWTDLDNEPPACWKDAWSLPDDVNVVVHSDHNHVPIADAGEEENEWLIGDTIELDGCGSMDGDGDPLTYTWWQTCGPPVDLENPGTCRPTYPADDDERRCFCLFVDDGWIPSLEDCTIHRALPNNNEPPFCRTGTEFWVWPGKGVVLDGAGSFDPNGDDLEYRWKQDTETEGCTTEEVRLAISEEGDTASFRAPGVPEGAEELLLCFRLTVSDGRADPVSCEARVHVVPKRTDVCDAEDHCDCPPETVPELDFCEDCPPSKWPIGMCQAPEEGEGEGPVRRCTEGALRTCTCPGGTSGNQTCVETEAGGTDWGTCEGCENGGNGAGPGKTKTGCANCAVGGRTAGPDLALLLGGLGLGLLARRRRKAAR